MGLVCSERGSCFILISARIDYSTDSQKSGYQVDFSHQLYLSLLQKLPLLGWGRQTHEKKDRTADRRRRSPALLRPITPACHRWCRCRCRQEVSHLVTLRTWLGGHGTAPWMNQRRASTSGSKSTQKKPCGGTADAAGKCGLVCEGFGRFM